MAYRDIAAGWHDFYIVAGTAAATLVGLLFVGLSLHLRVVVSRSEVRSLARVTLASFGILLLVSLFLVTPQGRTTAGDELIYVGAFSLIIIAPSIVSAARSGTRTLHFGRLIARFGLTVVAFLGVVVSGTLIVRDRIETAFHLLAGVAAVLLVISLRNSWDLLVSVGEPTTEIEEKTD